MRRRTRSTLDRRTVLRLLGVGSALALAGCTGDDEAEPDDGDGADEPDVTDGDDGGDGADESDGSTGDDGGGDGEAALEPVDVPEDAHCAVCDMMAANFPAWNAQAVHEDETRAFFCTSGCATTYYAVPDRFAETDAAVAGLWVTEFETGERIDGTTASYALETDSDRVDDPMRLNPAPFADRDDAIAYVDEVDYLTEDDVVELSAFDRELAAQYRSNFLEE